MKKLFAVIAAILVPALCQAATPFQTVRISTNNLSQQNGAFNVVGGSMTFVRASTLTVTSSGTFVGNVSVAGSIVGANGVTLSHGLNRLVNVSSPTSPSDAATKGYVDTFANGSTNYIQNTATLQSGATFFVSSGTASNLSATGFTALTSTSTNLNATTVIASTIIPTNIAGTTTNDNPGPGSFGFSMSSTTNNNHLATTTGQYGDVVSLALTAGDWQVSASAVGNVNVASLIGAMFVGISTTTGNSTAGLIDGYSVVFASAGILNTTNAFAVPFAIPPIRISLSAPGTVYLKYRADYQNSNPRISGGLRAIKPR